MDLRISPLTTAATARAAVAPKLHSAQGADGALLMEAEGRPRSFPSFPVDAVDATGAGDAFNGALACALASGEPIDKAITFANAAGALATISAAKLPAP